MSKHQTSKTSSPIILATLPLLDTQIITIGSALQMNFPEVDKSDGHPRYNFEYSWESIAKRTCVVNDLILDFEKSYNDLQKHVATVEVPDRDPLVFTRHLVRGEVVVGSLKTTADQLLSLLSVLKTKADTGRYGNKIARDDIASYKGKVKSGDKEYALFAQHGGMLWELNEAANGIKHSFLNLHVDTYYSDPSIMIYYLPRNNDSKNGSPVTIMFNRVIPGYNDFLKDIKNLISEYAKLITSMETGA